MYHNGNCEFTWFVFPMDPDQSRRAARLLYLGADQREESCLRIPAQETIQGLSGTW